MGEDTGFPITNISTGINFDAGQGGKFETHNLRWPDVKQETLRTTKICHLNNICISRLSDLAQKPNRYILLGKDEGQAAPQLQKELDECFHSDGHQLYLGRASDWQRNPLVTWMEGSTFAVYKPEKGNHPASWLRVFGTSFAAVATKTELFTKAGLTSSKFFHRFYVSRNGQTRRLCTT